MSQLFESIQLRYGIPKNLVYHQTRVNQAFEDLWPEADVLDLETELEKLDLNSTSAVSKCKVTYDENGVNAIESRDYLVQPIHKLYVTPIKADENYKYKYVDRSWIDAYTEGLEYGTDVLFVRDGLVLESSYTNVALLKDEVWYTPAHPLHVGTTLMRFKTLEHLKSVDIPVDDLQSYEQIKLFNAMLGWGDAYSLLYTQIVF